MGAKADGSKRKDFSTINQAPLHEDGGGRADTGRSNSPWRVYKSTFKAEKRYK